MLLQEQAEYQCSGASTESKSRAAGLYDRFSKGNTLLCLTLALSVFEVLENLCTALRALQGREATVTGMLEAVDKTVSTLTTLRSDDNFAVLYQRADDAASDCQLDAISLPRQIRPPKRRDSRSSNQHVFATAAAFFRPVYVTAIDTAIQSLHSRFDQHSFTTVKQLEECLLTGKVAEAVKCYPELDIVRLAVQLSMFRSSFSYNNVDQAVGCIQASSTEVKQLFCEVQKLLRLLLVLPVSSCEAERSFSSLRRLKTYLRSTMSQSRLNSVALLHAHQQEVMAIPVEEILKDFVSLNSSRMQTFGTM